MSPILSGVKVLVTGTVQGVGFRPFVYRTARRFGVVGTVRNTAGGVEIEAFARQEALDAFVRAVKTQTPPLAQVLSLESRPLSADGAPESFTIGQSSLGESAAVDVTRDTAVCTSCLSEMRSPNNRRYRHAFINCTDCGPRYTIVRSMPYDRPNTTMAAFGMCPECAAEYADPVDRRFHAQPVCCPNCGPQLRLLDASGCVLETGDAAAECVRLLTQGSIVAIKGIGGFHLACRADRTEVVARLRQRKHREEKPLAIMVRDVSSARALAEISDIEGELISGVERPIVIVRKRDTGALAPEVAPRVSTLGIMLPYAPLHHVLFENAPYQALVMTSANLSDEPMCIDDAEAVRRLGGIADAYLTHDRPIYVRNDDSIARVLGAHPVLLRRARGYVPAPLPADTETTGVCAWGGILRGTVTVGRGSYCYTSQYLGAMDSVEALDNLERVMQHLMLVLGVTPRVHACDMHPQGLTSRPAESSGLPVVKVQHHHAHAVACLAENRWPDEAIAVVYDGAGHGDDGTGWGGEILRVNRSSYERLGHLRTAPMPGGDEATRLPGRMALGILSQSGDALWTDACAWMPVAERDAVIEVLRLGLNCPLTSSMGRLFDACAAVLDVCRTRTYEGQPAIELEGCADLAETRAFKMPVITENGLRVLDGASLLLQVAEAVRGGLSPAVASARFHNAVVAATAQVVTAVCEETGIRAVCLSGGCFQNVLLFGRLVAKLESAHLRVLVHRLTPPNDECVSYGQAIVAAERGA